MNVIMISGKVVSAPLMQTSENNNGVAKFSIENTEMETQIQIVSIGDTAEFCSHLELNDQVFITGHLRAVEWKDDDQMIQRSFQIVVETIRFMDDSKQVVH